MTQIKPCRELKVGDTVLVRQRDEMRPNGDWLPRYKAVTIENEYHLQTIKLALWVEGQPREVIGDC